MPTRVAALLVVAATAAHAQTWRTVDVSRQLRDTAEQDGKRVRIGF